MNLLKKAISEPRGKREPDVEHDCQRLGVGASIGYWDFDDPTVWRETERVECTCGLCGEAT
jgi:hypothetical protein